MSDWYPPRVGGVERQIQGLAHELHARGHDVYVLTSSRGDADSNGVPVIRFDFPLFARGNVALPGPDLVRRIWEWLRDHQVDVVHAHGVFSSAAHAGVISADVLGVASVLTNHSLIRPGLRPFGRLIFLGSGYRADALTAVSRPSARDLRHVSGSADVTVIPNGIDLATVRRAPPAPAPDGEVRIIYVGRLARKKNPAGLIAAVPRVLGRVRDSMRVRFVLVGDGPERTRLVQQARDLGVADHVEFVGYQPRAEVDRLLAGAQIFASPVRKEAFGIAILEALAAGLPVVAMGGGGVGEIVAEGRTGLIADTPEAFAEGLARLAADVALRRSMAEAAVTGLEPFGWDAVIERHLEVYERAIASRGGRRKKPWRFRPA